jgi:DNA-binding XRE family transcriptional regulator
MTKFEELRTNAGVTVTQLSREANISRATIEKIEKDQPVRAALAARACNALSKHLGYQVTYQQLDIKTVK